MISLIAAMDRNRVIGQNGEIPWRLPADMTFFRQTTMGKAVIMGRKTWESLPAPLTGRTNIILTRDAAFKACDGAVVVHDIDSALASADKYAEDSDEIMIIGGAQLYQQFMDRADRIYLSQLDTEIDGDTYFPEIDLSNWAETNRLIVDPDEKNKIAFEIVTFERQ